MKRFSLFGFASVLSILIVGCPIYKDGEGGIPPCYGSECGNPNPETCTSSDQCGINETCGDDNQCHVGDCTIWGCSSGECVINDDLTASCGTPPVGNVVYCGTPKDCTSDQTCAPDGTCQPGLCDQAITGGGTLGCIYGFTCDTSSESAFCRRENLAGCGTEEECTNMSGVDLCVSGICTVPADQCFDQTQCDTGSKCAEGKCIPGCAGDADCITAPGFACNTQLGVCSVPLKTCTITNDCGSADSVCVTGACVPRSDGPNCAAGLVWVDNGCIANQSARFICDIDGQPGDGQPGSCAVGSVCLHHSCYISCSPPNAAACDALPSFNQCKDVITGSGTHQVCGSSQNLGGECGINVGGNECLNGGVCIDGFCR